MTDPISVASGILALTAFAIQSTKTLYDVIDSYRNKSRTVRELKEELEALDVVLQSLEGIQTDDQVQLSVLKLPLLRCGQACRNFAEIIEKSTARSSEDRASFRDWFKLTYRGKDIASFRNIIGAYKSTIAIALADVNIRHSNVTAKLLRQYKEMIDNTTSDLQEILEQADNELAKSSLQGESDSPVDPNEFNQLAIEEERASINHCLRVCKQVANHLEQVQAEILASDSMRDDSNDPIDTRTKTSPARLITSEKLKDCKTGIKFTISELQLRLQDADHRLRKLLHQTDREKGGGEDVSPTQQAPEDLDSIRQCLAICEEATAELMKERINVFEDVHMADDGHQVIVATLGDLISAKHISTGARSKQWLGQMSDTSLQQLSKDNRSSGSNSVTNNSLDRTSGDEDQENIDTQKPRITIHRSFEGAGRKLG